MKGGGGSCREGSENRCDSEQGGDWKAVKGGMEKLGGSL